MYRITKNLVAPEKLTNEQAEVGDPFPRYLDKIYLPHISDIISVQ